MDRITVSFDKLYNTDFIIELLLVEVNNEARNIKKIMSIDTFKNRDGSIPQLSATGGHHQWLGQNIRLLIYFLKTGCLFLHNIKHKNKIYRVEMYRVTLLDFCYLVTIIIVSN